MASMNRLFHLFKSMVWYVSAIRYSVTSILPTHSGIPIQQTQGSLSVQSHNVPASKFSQSQSGFSHDSFEQPIYFPSGLADAGQRPNTLTDQYADHTFNFRTEGSALCIPHRKTLSESFRAVLHFFKLMPSE